MNSEAFTGMLSSTLTTAKAYATAIGNTVVILLIFAGEVLVTDNVFKCPCHEEDYQLLQDPDMDYVPPVLRMYYGISFIVCPAFAIFFVALAVSSQTHRCLTATARTCSCQRGILSFKYFCSNASSTLLPPFAWLVMVFVDGRYFECIFAGIPSSCLPEDPSTYKINGKKASSDVLENIEILKARNVEFRAISQILAWSALGVFAAVAALLLLCAWCCDKTTYYQRKYMTTLRDKEMAAFHKVSGELLMSEMEKKWRVFFKEARKGDWRSISALPTGYPSRVNDRYYYSAFDMWLPHEERNNADQTGPGESLVVANKTTELEQPPPKPKRSSKEKNDAEDAPEEVPKRPKKKKDGGEDDTNPFIDDEEEPAMEDTNPFSMDDDDDDDTNPFTGDDKSGDQDRPPSIVITKEDAGPVANSKKEDLNPFKSSEEPAPVSQPDTTKKDTKPPDDDDKNPLTAIWKLF